MVNAEGVLSAGCQPVREIAGADAGDQRRELGSGLID